MRTDSPLSHNRRLSTSRESSIDKLPDSDINIVRAIKTVRMGYIQHAIYWISPIFLLPLQQ